MDIQLNVTLSLKKSDINIWCENKARDCNWANIYPNCNKCSIKEFSANAVCPFEHKSCKDITPKDWKKLLKPIDK